MNILLSQYDIDTGRPIHFENPRLNLYFLQWRGLNWTQGTSWSPVPDSRHPSQSCLHFLAVLDISFGDAVRAVVNLPLYSPFGFHLSMDWLPGC